MAKIRRVAVLVAALLAVLSAVGLASKWPWEARVPLVDMLESVADVPYSEWMAINEQIDRGLLEHASQAAPAKTDLLSGQGGAAWRGFCEEGAKRSLARVMAPAPRPGPANTEKCSPGRLQG